MNYYLLICADGARIPVYSKMTIRNLLVANAFADRDDVIKIVPLTFLNFLIATGGRKVSIF